MATQNALQRQATDLVRPFVATLLGRGYTAVTLQQNFPRHFDALEAAIGAVPRDGALTVFSGLVNNHLADELKRALALVVQIKTRLNLTDEQAVTITKEALRIVIAEEASRR